jgi:hypothetical protein
MHSPFRKRGLILAGLLALALAAVTPMIASATPEPGAKPRGFRLFARSLGAMTINRIYCGLASDGQVCVDSTNSSTIGGGFWPKGTADQYIFNSGLQLAGIIGTDGGDWAGDTTGAFFFDPKGTTQHGEEVRPIYNTTDDDDFANLPVAAKVPDSGPLAALFDPILQSDSTETDFRRRQASQGDVWWMSWDGNPKLNAGRSHPLGVLVETRGMGWNYPAGNEDIIYFIYTFYNITSTEEQDYIDAGIPDSTRAILMEKATEFHAENNAAFGVNLPTGGYTINELYAAFATDMDVADAGVNYASVNLPFALGFTYDHTFSRFSGWSFDPKIFAPPFFAGAGFSGIKYLKSPEGAGEIKLYGNTINGSPFAGAFNDPQNAIQLWRYLSGKVSVPAGDQPCNTGNPAITRICWINNTQETDMRFFQSSTALTLAPGGVGSIVVAYIFAAPVTDAACAPPCDIKPGDPRFLTNAATLGGPTTVNAVDRMTGFLSWTDVDGDAVVDQAAATGAPEFTVVNGSLLGKSYTAQAVFDNLFLLPFAPTKPEFFLIPGDNQVSVLWKPSPSEAAGDPFFDSTQDAIGKPALYDPNYRQFDVEGYRVYRGRVDAPNSLTLVAQFDYIGTFISDFAGQVNPDVLCAPELAITESCPITYDPVTPGVPRVAHVDVPLVGPIVQVKLGERAALATGEAILLASDTAVTGGASGLPELEDTGVPFTYVDRNVRNNFRYFYTVTAFDINSFQSGPTNLESPKITKSVTPVRGASNAVNTGALTVGIYGRGVNQSGVFTSTPTIDATNGTFSGPFPPANGGVLGFVGEFASKVVANSGALVAKLDSLSLGQVELINCCAGGRVGIPAVYYFTVTTATETLQFSIPVQQGLGGDGSNNVLFDAVKNVNQELASLYGGDSTYALKGQLTQNLTSGPIAGDWGLGAGLAEPGFTADDRDAHGAVSGGVRYNGARWFDGPSPANNEVEPNPIKGACGVGLGAACGSTLNFNNAGKLTGVTTVYQPLSYTMFNREWRNVGESQSSARRAADYNIYWSTSVAGLVDSVIDVTHNVPVEFNANKMAGTWGILNQAATAAAGSKDGRAGVLTPLDWTCVEPFRSVLTQPDRTFFPCSSAAPFLLSNTAVLGPVAFAAGDNQVLTGQSAQNPANLAADPGFAMYVAGTISQFSMPSLPALGAVWSLRDYTGIIYGGNGDGGAGNEGPYSFEPSTRPFTAVGAEIRVVFDAVNRVNEPTNKDLKQVHTVPDPYYVTSEFESTTDSKVIKFVNLPADAIIRIYSSSGVLVTLLEHHSDQFGGSEDWDVRNRAGQFVASGVYFYHIESGDATRIGRMTIVNFAQ